jgi:hypothetical protein
MTLEEAIEIADIGAGRYGYRTYGGSGGMWAGTNTGFADAQFTDWGLAKATAIILNAVLDGRLEIKKCAQSLPVKGRVG